VDDVATDYAIGFMRQNQERPWAMAVGFKSPHGPFEPPARWAGQLTNGWLKPAPNLTNLPPFPDLGNPTPPPPAAHGPPGAWQANLDYFRCLAAVDENVGRLLDTLDELRLTDDTLVVYASDNGFYLREHGLGDKRSAYDESLRIPLLVRYPRLGLRGKTSDEMVLNLDLAPTWLDFASVAAPKEMQGRSWRPLLEGRTVPWRRSFFFEYFWEPQRGNTTPSLTGVRTQTAKLIRYQGHPEWTELFDLARDPYEMKNLYRDPAGASLRAELETEYERQQSAVGYVWPSYADDPEQFLPQKPLNAVVLEYRFDRDRGERVTDVSGRENHGLAKGATLAGGRAERQARRFDGEGHIEVPKSPSLNPGVRAWTIEVAFKSAAPDGVLVGHGGASFGYCLALEQGRPTFTVVANQELSRVASKRVVTGQWTTLTARYAAGWVSLAIDSQPPERAPLRAAISREPNDGLQIGADTGSPVLGDKRPPPFTGLIESVRLISGELP
jgi:hypothetical protein